MRPFPSIPLLLMLALSGGSAIASKPGETSTPVDLTGVGMIERPGAQVDLALSFLDEKGRHVTLDDFLLAGKPIVLNLGYFNCPSVCNLVMNGMTDAMKETSLLPGRDYVVISLSIDPGETHKLALAKKSNYLRALGNVEAGAGWHFLTGSEANIKAVAEAVGYRYKWVAEAREYAHPAGLVILTPDGKVSRYLHGKEFEGKTFRLSLVEASEGKIGSIIDQLMLICFAYDKDKHKYTVAAVGLMKMGGAATIVTLAALAVLAIRRERRNRLTVIEPSIGQQST